MLSLQADQEEFDTPLAIKEKLRENEMKHKLELMREQQKQ